MNEKLFTIRCQLVANRRVIQSGTVKFRRLSKKILTRNLPYKSNLWPPMESKVKSLGQFWVKTLAKMRSCSWQQVVIKVVISLEIERLKSRKITDVKSVAIEAHQVEPIATQV